MPRAASASLDNLTPTMVPSGLVPANSDGPVPSGSAPEGGIGRLDGTTPILTDKGWTPIGFHDGATLSVWTGTRFAPMRVVSKAREDGEPWDLVAVRLTDGSDLLCSPGQLLPLHELGPQGDVVPVREAIWDRRLQRAGWPLIEMPAAEVEFDEEGKEIPGLDHYTQGF